MGEGFVHTVHVDGRWTNTIEGSEGANHAAFDTKEAAVEAGRGEARRRRSAHVIHNQDGSIAERNSYGSDPADRSG
jgi:uncharacterized protein DUF2188